MMRHGRRFLEGIQEQMQTAAADGFETVKIFLGRDQVEDLIRDRIAAKLGRAIIAGERLDRVEGVKGLRQKLEAVEGAQVGAELVGQTLFGVRVFLGHGPVCLVLEKRGEKDADREVPVLP
jgi:hypothetical protein